MFAFKAMSRQFASFTTDYYKVLGVAKTAKPDAIKTAYRSLAKKYHPDAKTGSEEKFKELSNAYQVLSDEQQRAAYDAASSYGQGGTGSGQYQQKTYSSNAYNANDFKSYTKQNQNFYYYDPRTGKSYEFGSKASWSDDFHKKQNDYQRDAQRRYE